MSTTSRILAAILLLPSLPLVAQVDDRYHLSMAGPTNIAEQATGSVSILFDSVPGTAGAPGLLHGWSYGVCHDNTFAQLVSVVDGATTATINSGIGPAFNAIQTMPVSTPPFPSPGPNQGFIVGVIIDLTGNFNLLPGTGYEFNVATYLGLGPAVLSLEFCEVLSTPPVVVRVNEIGLPGDIPVQTGLTLSIAGFRRGDCNDDGATNITDAVTTLLYLFPQGPPPNLACEKACDADDDGAINLSDAIRILDALFLGGTPPPPPHVTCGIDGTPDALTCAGFTMCL
ncbi:MAG: dockerin type I repeat-containing protein [Planctomycetota bacterium]